MASEKILIVEDEAIVAADLEQSLKRLGYNVVGIAATGTEAIRLADLHKPDLVLMDIRIKGDQDGIETAEQLVVHHNVPVTYLTAYADERTLERAKSTLPYGYILKPFEERELRTSIEVALYKHRMNTLLEKMDASHGTTLRSLAMAIVTTDPKGRVTYMNTRAETLLNTSLEKALGQNLKDVQPTIPAPLTITPQSSFKEAAGGNLLYNVSALLGDTSDEEGFVVSFFPKAV